MRNPIARDPLDEEILNTLRALIRKGGPKSISGEK
jgi:hypothetical protein